MVAVNREIYKHLLFENRQPKNALRKHGTWRYNFYIRLNRNIENLRDTYYGSTYHYMVVLLDTGELVYCSVGEDVDKDTSWKYANDPFMAFIGSGIVHHFESN